MMKRRTTKARTQLRLPTRSLALLIAAGMATGLCHEAGAAVILQKHVAGAPQSGSLPDLARGRQAAIDGRFDDAEADLRPLAEHGYVQAQIALARLYAHAGTPDRIAAAIGWLRAARRIDPESTETPLGRLLVRQSDTASLTEGEALLQDAWQERKDPQALAGLIRLYSEHPQLDRDKRATALVALAEPMHLPEVEAAVIDWYRSTPQIAGHPQRVVVLCEASLDVVPECYVDLARAARARNDVARLKTLATAAGRQYDRAAGQAQMHGRESSGHVDQPWQYNGATVQAQTLASLARVLVEDEPAAADDPLSPATLPVTISDLPEEDDEAGGDSLRILRSPVASDKACASDPVLMHAPGTGATDARAAGPATGTLAQAPAPAAQPELANALLGKLLHGPDDAPVLAVGVAERYTYLLPGADLEAILKQGQARGIPDARLDLGLLYLLGTRVPRDPQRALDHLQAAAASPTTALQAHYLLGRLYQYGYLDESRPVLAAEYLLWAARRGYTPADVALARLFANGKGMCPNLADAYVFARLGSREGNAPIATLLGLITARLTPAQRAQADRTLEAERRARPSAYAIPATVLAREASQYAASSGRGPLTESTGSDGRHAAPGKNP